MMKRNRMAFVAALMGIALLAALPAKAAMFSFSFTDFATGGDTIDASGTFTATASGSNWLVTGISGLYNGSAMTLTSVGGFQGNDNILNSSSPFLSILGISFTVGAQNYNVYYDAAPPDFAPCSDCYAIFNGSTDTQINFTASPVPLPAAAWLLLSGLAGVGFIGRRKKVA